MQIQPYLFFDGRAEEALNFYKKVLGAKNEMVMKYKDMPDPQPGSGEVRIKVSVPDGKPQVVRGGSYRW